MLIAALRAIWGAAQLVPLKVWLWLALVAAVLGWVLIDRHQQRELGREEVRAEWKAQEAKYKAELAKEKERQAQVVERVVVEYRDRVKVVKEVGEEVIREVERVVPVSGEFSGGFRVLHDAAATGVLPEDPAGVARTAPPVDAATTARTVFANYAECRAQAERLSALQQLVKEAMK